MKIVRESLDRRTQHFTLFASCEENRSDRFSGDASDAVDRRAGQIGLARPIMDRVLANLRIRMPSCDSSEPLVSSFTPHFLVTPENGPTQGLRELGVVVQPREVTSHRLDVLNAGGLPRVRRRLFS